VGGVFVGVGGLLYFGQLFGRVMMVLIMVLVVVGRGGSGAVVGFVNMLLLLLLLLGHLLKLLLLRVVGVLLLSLELFETQYLHAQVLVTVQVLGF